MDALTTGAPRALGAGLAARAFDASSDDAVVAGSEFLAELQAWAEANRVHDRGLGGRR